MRSTYSPCLPTSAKIVPATPNWLHEVKYDGYRLIVVREGNRVRLFTRNGHDWSGRFPWIVEAALKNRRSQFVIDGEAVILGVDGVSDFNALHSRRRDEDVRLYAFDILAFDGEDLRGLPLSFRKPKEFACCAQPREPCAQNTKTANSAKGRSAGAAAGKPCFGAETWFLCPVVSGGLFLLVTPRPAVHGPKRTDERPLERRLRGQSMTPIRSREKCLKLRNFYSHLPLKNIWIRLGTGWSKQQHES